MDAAKRGRGRPSKQAEQIKKQYEEQLAKQKEETEKMKAALDAAQKSQPQPVQNMPTVSSDPANDIPLVINEDQATPRIPMERLPEAPPPPSSAGTVVQSPEGAPMLVKNDPTPVPQPSGQVLQGAGSLIDANEGDVVELAMTAEDIGQDLLPAIDGLMASLAPFMIGEVLTEDEILEALDEHAKKHTRARQRLIFAIERLSSKIKIKVGPGTALIVAAGMYYVPAASSLASEARKKQAQDQKEQEKLQDTENRLQKSEQVLQNRREQRDKLKNEIAELEQQKKTLIDEKKNSAANEKQNQPASDAVASGV